MWWTTSNSTAERAVLVAQGVEAVRAGRDDLLDARLVEGLDVLLGEHLEDELVADPAGRVAGAGLALAQDREVDAGLVQQRRDRPGGLLRPVLERARAADPEEVFEVVASPTRLTSKSRPLVQSSRVFGGAPHGLPLFSRLRSMTPASDGNDDSISTW